MERSSESIANRTPRADPRELARPVTPHRFERTLASSCDIVPTVLAATGVKSGDSLPGVNLLDAKALAEREAVFGSVFVHTSIDSQNPARNLKYRWIVEGDWKLIVPYPPNRDLLVWGNLSGVTGWRTTSSCTTLRATRRRRPTLLPVIASWSNASPVRWIPVRCSGMRSSGYSARSAVSGSTRAA